jgi:hypothetical protein
MGGATRRFSTLLNATGDIFDDEMDEKTRKPYSSFAKHHHSHHNFIVG